MYNLFLDDIRDPKDVNWVKLPEVEWVVVRNADAFINHIKLHGMPNIISFDHDLGPEHYTFDWSGNSTAPGQLCGMDCARWLVSYALEHKDKFPDCYFHTMNPVGKQNMQNCINDYKAKNETKGKG